MRNLEKSDKPDVLVKFADQWIKELEVAVDGSKEFKEIQGRYRNPEIRDRLRDEVARKCAYCESDIEAVSYPHIEHIHPKSTNRALTFEWTNLTLACTKCNVEKGDTDPTPNNFVNPYDGAAEVRFSFLGSFMRPAPNDLAARNMIHWLDLNRPALIISRTEIVDRVLAIYEEAIKLPTEARREFITLAMRPLKSISSRYSRVAECAEQIFEEHYAAALAQ